MIGPIALIAFQHHSPSGGGLGHLFGFLAHAVLWSTVSRLVWHSPVGIVVLVAIVAAVFVVRSISARRGVFRRRGR